MLGLWQGLPHPLAARGWRAANAACVRAGGLPPGPRLAPLRPQAGRQALYQLVPAFTAGVVFGTAPHHACGGSRLALAWGMGTVCRAQGNLVDGCGQRRAGQVLGSRRRRWARACVGWAVRTGSACRGHGLAIHLAQVVVPGQFQRQHALLARLQPGLQRFQQAWADHSSSASAGCGQRGQLPPGQTVRAGSSQVCVWGRRQRAVQRVQGQAPSRRATPSRGKARNWPQVLQPMRARLATWGRSAVRVQGQIVRHAPGGHPACCSRSSARAWNDGALGKGAAVAVHGAMETPARPPVQVQAQRRFPSQAHGLQQGQQRRAAAPQALSRRHLQQQRLIHRATLG